MSTRLLVRCIRLLGSNSLGVSALPAACRLPLTTSAPPLAAVTLRLHTSTSGGRSEGQRLAQVQAQAQEDGFLRKPERTELDDLIDGAGSVEELLQVWAERGGTGNQAATVLIQLARLSTTPESKTNTAEILQDRRFQQLLQTVDTQISLVWNGTLVNLLRSLSQLGVSPGEPAVRCVQNEAHWRLRRLSYRHLVSLADSFAGQARDEQQRVLLSDVVKQLELRWTEISEPRNVALLMGKLGHLSGALMDRLEDKALELAERFSPEDTRRVALALAAQSRRSVPLLRALSYHLVQKHGIELQSGLLVDLAFAYGKLNFHQTQVFQRIASDLLPRVPELGASDITRCAKSFAYLKWLNLPLFEAFAQHVLVHSEKYSTPQMCNLVLAFARLNYQPIKGDAFYSKVHEKLDSALGQLDPYMHTDVVWSLCVLQQARPSYLQSVLEPDFYKKLTGSGGSSSRDENYMLKLLHINTTATLECPEYRGSALPAEACMYPGERKASALQSGLREALRGLVGEQQGLYHSALSTVYGWTIDGELVLNSESKPVPLKDLAAPHLPQAGGATPLPPGAKRIAFLACEFPHYNSRSKDLLGRFVMQRRHLQLAGFLTVDVPYYEWLELKSDWQKVAYLKDKMGKAVAEDMAK
ncbi:FAST kinase domain-containing protein 4-like [Huso huso]|uniref:FAST kinase domain-containing protein 4 n=1 Tax=Huso huso TaxID=61971 RepID=A0ABR1A3T6_HUSHU